MAQLPSGVESLGQRGKGFMGFFSSITGGQKTNVPASGFYSQPAAYQSLYNNVLGQAGQVAGQLNTDAFTPLAQTQDETNAFNAMRQGFAPNQQSLQNDISMFTNPFDSYVIDGINRESQGQNSLVNQAATQAGQQGSNRSFLGSSDVEQNRLNNIGQFRQSNYNNAVNNVLGPLAGLRQQDATNQLGIGQFERGLDSATKQAPYAAVNANLGILNQVPTQFGNFGTQAQTIKTGGGLGGLLKTVAPLALNAFAPGAGTALGAAMGGGIGSTLAGLGAQYGLTGGLDPSSGINWNSGGGFFGGFGG